MSDSEKPESLGDNVPRQSGLGKVSEVAEYLRIGHKRVYAMLDSGELPKVVLGPHSWRIRWSDVYALVDSQIEVQDDQD